MGNLKYSFGKVYIFLLHILFVCTARNAFRIIYENKFCYWEGYWCDPYFIR